jgi:hypothetical protein
MTVGGFFLLRAPLVIAGTVDQAPAAPPLKFESRERVSLEYIASIKDFLGVDEAFDAEIGTFTDEHSFSDDNVHEGAIRLSFEDILIANPSNGREALIRTFVVLDKSARRIMAAYTEPSAEWDVPCPTLPATDIEAEAGGFAKSIAPASNRTQHTPFAVLRALWETFGVDPLEVGQIVLRPREFLTAWPPRRGSEGLALDAPRNHVYWICQIMGRVAMRYPEVPGAYHTQRILLLSDEDLQSGQGYYAR